MGLIASNKAHKVGKLYFLNNSKNNIQTVPPKKKKTRTKTQMFSSIAQNELLCGGKVNDKILSVFRKKVQQQEQPSKHQYIGSL